jgi:hypothetical protein
MMLIEAFTMKPIIHQIPDHAITVHRIKKVDEVDHSTVCRDIKPQQSDREKVIDCLTINPGGLMYIDICKVVRINKTRCRDTIRELAAEGIIEQVTFKKPILWKLCQA